jgi:transcriptional regulator with XRE-family HTH domain
VTERSQRYGGFAADASPGARDRSEAPPSTSENDRDAVLVRAFNPDRGTAVIEFRKRRWRYTQERSADQVIAMADYLRARRGFSSDQEMAEVLGVHRTRLAAWKQGADVPNPQNAQLLSHLAVVVTELQEFLDAEVISDWLRTDQYTLSGRTPVRALREGMLAEVLQTANAAEHGAYI